MNPASLRAEEVRLYREAAANLLLWRFRLHPRPISVEAEDLPDSVRGEIAFGAMVSHAPASLPLGMTSEVADRIWSANLYKARAAAFLAIGPREAERRVRQRLEGPQARPGDLSVTERGILSRAAESLGIADKQLWYQDLRAEIDRLLDHPLNWNGVEVLVTATKGRGMLSEFEVEHLLERADSPREPWPDWMPGKESRKEFHFS